jgi:hypothetical protein
LSILVVSVSGLSILVVRVSGLSILEQSRDTGNTGYTKHRTNKG